MLESQKTHDGFFPVICITAMLLVISLLYSQDLGWSHLYLGLIEVIKMLFHLWNEGKNILASANGSKFDCLSSSFFFFWTTLTIGASYKSIEISIHIIGSLIRKRNKNKTKNKNKQTQSNQPTMKPNNKQTKNKQA